MCGMAMVALGTNAGFTAGIYNPFSVGTAQHIAELPLYSGASMRWITLIILNVVTSIYIMWYANKHRISGKERKEEVEIKIDCKMMSKRQKLVLLEFVCTFVILTVGIAKWGWSTKEIIVVFLLASIIIGTSYGFSGNQICELYIVGARRLLKGAFVIGIAATIRLVLNEGNILDTITYNLTNILYVLPKEIQLIGILFLNALLDRKSTRLNSSHIQNTRMPSSA